MPEDKPKEKSKEDQSNTENKPKPCCACPETRRPRDECIVERGEENCQEFIIAHRACMAKYGYKV